MAGFFGTIFSARAAFSVALARARRGAVKKKIHTHTHKKAKKNTGKPQENCFEVVYLPESNVNKKFNMIKNVHLNSEQSPIAEHKDNECLCYYIIFI